VIVAKSFRDKYPRNSMITLSKWNPLRKTEWNPFQELQEFENRLAGFFGRSPVRTNGDKQEAISIADWAPLVDISEDDKEFLVKAELPEVKKDDVRVSVENGVLNISGERKVEKEEKDKKYHRVERAYGRFERSFTLPDGADGTKITAEFKEGVLKVHLPKTETAKPKSVTVKVA
jgi:HSP20 family protein